MFFYIIIIISYVFICVIVFAGQTEQNGILAEIIHLFPYHGRDIYTGMRTIQGKNRFIAAAVLDTDFAAPCNIDQNKLAFTIGMIAANGRRIRPKNIEQSFGYKRNILVALAYDKTA